jgi:Phage capsid protein
MTESVATYSVPEHHVNQYTGNVRAALNKQGGVITSLVSRGAYRGDKIQLINFLGPVVFVERNTPYGDTKVTEVEHTQRWITGKEYDCAVFIDRLDTLKMIYDPTSPYVERFREAAARRMDQIVMDKFFGDAKSGKEASTTVTFPAADIVAHGGTGCTVAKLRSLRKLIKKRHVDLRATKPMIAVTSEEIDDLLGETSVNSFDYNSVKPLVDGEVSAFMGFVFVPYEPYMGIGIPTYDDTGTVRQCPVWVPDGMHYGDWDMLNIIISPRPDKNNIKQIHGTFTGGATRVEEGRVFQLQCKE